MVKQIMKSTSSILSALAVSATGLSFATGNSVEAATNKASTNSNSSASGKVADTSQEVLHYKASQTINYVDTDGKKLANSNKQTVEVIGYKAKAQETKKGSVTIKIVDKTTGQTLSTTNYSGAVGSTYDASSVQKQLQDLQNKGYKVTSSVESGTIPDDSKNIEIPVTHNSASLIGNVNTGMSKVTNSVKSAVSNISGNNTKKAYADTKTDNKLTTNDLVYKVIVNGKTVGTNLTKDQVKTKIAAVKSPTIKGYQLKDSKQQTIAAKTLNVDDPSSFKNSTINVVYQKVSKNNKQTAQRTIKYVDSKGKTIGTAIIHGKLGEFVSIPNLKIPEGYTLAKGEKLPTKVQITADDKPIIIHVVPGVDGSGSTSASNKVKKVTTYMHKNSPIQTGVKTGAATTNNSKAKPKKNSLSNLKSTAILPQTGDTKSNAGILAGGLLTGVVTTLALSRKDYKQ